MKTRWRSDAGYSLMEMLVSTAIMLVVTGAVFSLVNPSQGISRVQPEFSDMQQRARVAADTLFRDLVMAGAGPYQGATTGSLANYFAPILPYRTGRSNPDPPGSFKDNTITIVYVPNTSSQTTISDPMPNESAELKVNPQNGCPPDTNNLCGFHEGQSVLIFNPQTGAFDTFEITEVQAPAAHIQHRGQVFSEAYLPGAVVTETQSHTYYFDANQNQLRHYDGLANANSDVPVVDNVVALRFDYYGDPNPPTSPRPPSGVQNCVVDSSGNPRLPTLAAETGSLVHLDRAILTDGRPDWCGAGTNAFDPDLLRIRKVTITLRVQASDPALRGTDTRFFARPGKASLTPGGWVPDYETTFEVTPRNMNLVR
ncbi:MAG: PilW family protein [Acidobacteriota bacterium]